MTVWLAACETAWRAAVRIVASDPSTTYRRAVQDALLQARIVADHFHLVRLTNERASRSGLSRPIRAARAGRTYPAWAKRLRLLLAGERLSERSSTRMWDELVDADLSGELLAAWRGDTA